MKKKSVFQAVLLVLSALSWAVYDYIALPAYNHRSFEFWIMAAAALAAIVLVFGLFGRVRKAILASFIAFAAVAAIAFLLSIGDWTLWPGNQKRLASQLAIVEKTEADFADDFSAAGPGTGGGASAGSFLLPIVDKDQAAKMVKEKAGDLGDQFMLDFENASTVLAKRDGVDRLLRLVPVEYSGKQAALARGARGTIGYVEVDLANETARLVEVEGGMKCGPGAILANDLMRRVRSKNRTALLGECHFEIDDAGKPWWIVLTMKKGVGMFGGPDTDGIVLVDASDGAVRTCRAGQEPPWVDRTVSFELARSQAENALRLKKDWGDGAFKEKRGNLALSDGYSHAITLSASGGRAWLAAGVSPTNASSSGLVGFMMIDLKAKEASLYAMEAVDEMRAMDLAREEGRASGQAMDPGWPMLVPAAGKPAYFMIMRNAEQRRYVFMDAAEGSDVAASGTFGEAYARMTALIGGGRENAEITAEIEPRILPEEPQDAGKDSTDSNDPATARFVVLRVKESDGQMLFIAQGDPDTLYAAPIGLSNGVRFLKAGDSVVVRYRVSGGSKDRAVVELENLSLER